MFYYYFNPETSEIEGVLDNERLARILVSGTPWQLPSSGGEADINILLGTFGSYIPRYHYIWSQKEARFIRFNGKSEKHDLTGDSGPLVAVIPDRLPVEKHLMEPITFISPAVAAEWVRVNTNGTPAFYSDRPILVQDPRRHVHLNNIIINVSDKTFAWDHVEEYPFSSAQDGIIITVLDRNGERAYPPALFGHDGEYLRCNSPAEARETLRRIMDFKLN